MTRNRLTLIYLAAFWALSIPLEGGPAGRDRIRILTSIFPLREFAAAVAGDRGEARLLLPPGAGVHTWQPRTRDLLDLSRCDLFIFIGADLEPWLPDLLKGLGGARIRTLEVSSGLDLMRASRHGEGGEPGHEEHGALDPHIWLDFGLDALIVDKIRDKLSSFDPEGATVFNANATVLKSRLKEIDERFRSGLARCRRKTLLLAGHAAFGYLARRYGLEQLALYGLSPDAQPTPTDLIELIKIARAKGATTVYFERAASPGLAETLAREIGARTQVLNAAHNLTRAEIRKGTTFFDIMEGNLRSLEDGLECGPQR